MRNIRRATEGVIGVLLTLSTLAPSVRAESEPIVGGVQRVEAEPQLRFGDRGSLVISSEAGLHVSYTTVDASDGVPIVRLLFRPSLDYFVADRFSLGGFGQMSHESRGEFDSVTIIAAGMRVGYDVPLSAHLSLWPTLSAAYASVNASFGDPYGTALYANGSDFFSMGVYVPLLVHPAPHFFLGFGPAVEHEFLDYTAPTTISGRFTLGGWF